jgi:hypothetical protein
MIRLTRETRDVTCVAKGWDPAWLFAMSLYAVALARGDRGRIREIAAGFVEGSTFDANTGLAMLTGDIEHRIEADGSLVFMVPV